MSLLLLFPGSAPSSTVVVAAYGTIQRPNRASTIQKPDRLGTVKRPNRVSTLTIDRSG